MLKKAGGGSHSGLSDNAAQTITWRVGLSVPTDFMPFLTKLYATSTDFYMWTYLVLMCPLMQRNFRLLGYVFNMWKYLCGITQKTISWLVKVRGNPPSVWNTYQALLSISDIIINTEHLTANQKITALTWLFQYFWKILLYCIATSSCPDLNLCVHAFSQPTSMFLQLLSLFCERGLGLCFRERLTNASPCQRIQFKLYMWKGRVDSGIGWNFATQSNSAPFHCIYAQNHFCFIFC